MNPPSGVHTGRVSIGGALAGVGAHCTWYPRSVSKGTGSPHARASAAEWAPAAITTVPASVDDPSDAVTRTPDDARVTPVTRPLPGAFARVPSSTTTPDAPLPSPSPSPSPSPHRISPPAATNPSAMARRSAAGSRRNHPSGNHHAPPVVASGRRFGSSSRTPAWSIASIARASPPSPSRRNAATAAAAAERTSRCNRTYPRLAAKGSSAASGVGACAPMGPSTSTPACSHAPR